MEVVKTMSEAMQEQASLVVRGTVRGLTSAAWVTFNVLGEEFTFDKDGEFRVSIAPRRGNPVSVEVVDYSSGTICKSFGEVEAIFSDITGLVVRCEPEHGHEGEQSMFWFCAPPFFGIFLVFVYFTYRRGVKKTFRESWQVGLMLVGGYLTMLANNYTRDNAGSGYKPIEVSRRWAYENTMFLLDVEDFFGFKSEMDWQAFWLPLMGDRFWNLVYMIIDAVCANIALFAAGCQNGQKLYVARTCLFWCSVCLVGMLSGSLFPVMPPRLLNSCTQYGACTTLHGVIKDTLVSAGHAEGHHGSDQNMYMAVPSFHIIFMIFAWGGLEDFQLKPIPPAIWCILSILVWWSTIVTGNHVWLDGIISILVVVPCRMAFYWVWDKVWQTDDRKAVDPFPEMVQDADAPNEYAGVEVQLTKIVIYSLSLLHILIIVPLVAYCFWHHAFFQSNLVTVAVIYSLVFLYQLKFKYYDQLSNLPSPFSSRSRQLMWFCLGFLIKIAVWWFAVTLAFHSILRHSRALPWHARERTPHYTYHKVINNSEIVIPKIIHQTEDQYGSTNLSALHYESELPDWEFSVWTNEEVRHLIEGSYPWFLDTWDNHYTEESRTVAARYFVLHKYGGVFVENNLLVTSKFNFETYLKGHSFMVAESPHYGVTGDFMAGVPNHSFLTRLTRELTIARDKWKGFPENIRSLSNIGGHFLTLNTETKEFRDSVTVMRTRDWVPGGFLQQLFHEHAQPKCEVSGNKSGEGGCFLCEDQPLFAYLHGETWKSFILTSLKPLGYLMGGFFKNLFLTSIVVYLTGPQAWISYITPSGYSDKKGI